jgi:predicted amidohydrolase YtcJ
MTKRMAADYIFINGPVITVDKDDRIEEALATKGNRILFVGAKNEALEYADENSRIIDLKGRSLIPGFIDSHIHTAVFGANLLAIDCRSPKVSSIEDIKRLVAEAAQKAPKGAWIRGWGYAHSKLKEQRHPARWDLDEAAPDNPVILTRVCAHMSVHNSRSLELAGITDDSVPCPGGENRQDRRQGHGPAEGKRAHAGAEDFQIERG